MGLLSGISNLGLDGLEKANIYEEEKEETVKQEKPEEPAKPQFNEADVLFDKSYECPICGSKFTNRAVRTGKARLISSDPDLRPKYDKFDPAKYDVVVCDCGYACLTRYFAALPQAQVKLVKDNICGKVKGVDKKQVLSYDDAIQRYQLALASAIVKRAKDSEKAYICLKMAWLIRGKKETISDEDPNYDELMDKLRADENEALKSAFEGFIAARSKEGFPMCGMDETTMDYLLAVLAARFQHFDIAQKLVGSILVSKTANARIKDRARDLKDQILMDMQILKEQK